MSSPADFAKKYQFLTVNDPLLGLNTSVTIKKYVSGKNDISLNDKEYYRVMGSIAMKYFNKSKSINVIPQTFYINGEPKVSPTEPFFKTCIRRAFACRGSPEEMTDALRLAVLTKKCEAGAAQMYADTWFGQDCNAFVGNWQGLSPYVGIQAYAHGFGKGAIKGAGESVEQVRELLPLLPRKDPQSIKQGDVIIVYGDLTQYHHHLDHIALVQSFHYNASNKTALIEVAEYTTSGAQARAATTIAVKTDLTCANNELPGKLIGYQDGTKMKYFFDASKWKDLACRGWQIGIHPEGAY